MDPIDVVVLGANGYVGGEVLRLLSGHPELQLSAAVSRSQAGHLITDAFPHLRLAYPNRAFDSFDSVPEILAGNGPLILITATPHGDTAALIDDMLSLAEDSERDVTVVDTSADFRFSERERYESIYGVHGAPDRVAEFACHVPDLAPAGFGSNVKHRVQPGCFTTAVTLACAPLHVHRLTTGMFAISAVTGSTGSGRNPSATTHHPERHSGMRAYKPLTHRHSHEMAALLGGIHPSGVEPTIAFVPHSGPFARGIYATVHATLTEPVETESLVAAYRDYYAHTPFVEVSAEPPNLKEVVGSNLCRIGIAAEGEQVVVFSAIDNLVKGSAGGAIQWVNQLFGFESTAGLQSPALGWN